MIAYSKFNKSNINKDHVPTAVLLDVVTVLSFLFLWYLEIKKYA